MVQMVFQTKLRFGHNRKKKIRGFSFNKAFSLQIHSFACGAMANVERREGTKSCGDRSGQNDRWNRYPSVAGKRPNPTLLIEGLKISV